MVNTHEIVRLPEVGSLTISPNFFLKNKKMLAFKKIATFVPNRKLSYNTNPLPTPQNVRECKSFLYCLKARKTINLSLNSI
mgnify:CR=1 FL=1